MSTVSYHNLKAAYGNVENFIQINSAKRRSIKLMADGHKNVQAIPLLISETSSGSGPLNILVKISSVKRDVIQMMNKLPIEVNIEIADKIRAEIASGNWPTNKGESNKAIKAMIRDYASLIN